MATETNKKKDASIEEILNELEGMADELEKGELPLEDAFVVYEKAVSMLANVHERIDMVEKKMKVLRESDEEGTT